MFKIQTLKKDEDVKYLGQKYAISSPFGSGITIRKK
jgi:hypothetical protein